MINQIKPNYRFNIAINWLSTCLAKPSNCCEKTEKIGSGSNKIVCRYDKEWLIGYFKNFGSYYKRYKYIESRILDNGAIYPEQRLVCDINTRKKVIIIEDWGDTLEKQILTNPDILQSITDNQLIKFVINLTRLSSEEFGLATDTKLANLTFDPKNGLRIIDVGIKSKKMEWLDFQTFAGHFGCDPRMALVYLKKWKRRREDFVKWQEYKVVDLFFRNVKYSNTQPIRDQWEKLYPPKSQVGVLIAKTLAEITNTDLEQIKKLLEQDLKQTT